MMKSIRLRQEKYQENIQLVLNSLLKDDSLCDITFHCQDGCIRAHKIILSVCSPYFKRIFSAHADPKLVYILHGISVKQMTSLIELMYRGITDISCDMTTKLYQVAEDFGITGIISENDKLPQNSCPRDTRFRGQKRVAVDFLEDDKRFIEKLPKMDNEKESLNTCTEKAFNKPIGTSLNTLQAQNNATSIMTINPKNKCSSIVTAASTMPLSAAAKRSRSWALKQRKYKCDLCSAGFKRASHLTRHQLVHTGERPYACNQCDKAFSRHDKLKHHIKKNHENTSTDEIRESESSFNGGNITIRSDNINLDELSDIKREDVISLSTPKSTASEHKSEMVVNVCSDQLLLGASENDSTTPVGQKKGRGRPRKYPPAPKPLIKRPRGRPRVHLVDQQTGNPINQMSNSENYDITNLPYGDLEYLTKPLSVNESSQNNEDSSRTMDVTLMEPLVEIKMDQNEQENRTSETPTHSFFKTIGLLESSNIATFGECTISVSNTGTNTDL